MSEWAKQRLVDFNPNKTEVMYFSLAKAIKLTRFTLIFQSSQLNFCPDTQTLHVRHILSEDGRWHKHILDIISSASRILGSRLKRNTLNRTYISYLKPI